MLLNCWFSFHAHILPESPLRSNNFFHWTNVQQLPLAVWNNCNCLSFDLLSLSFNLAPRCSLRNMFVLEDAASCSQRVFFFPSFFLSFSFCRGWSLRARLRTTDTQRHELISAVYKHLGWDLGHRESLVGRERKASVVQQSTSTSFTSAFRLPSTAAHFSSRFRLSLFAVSLNPITCLKLLYTHTYIQIK